MTRARIFGVCLAALATTTLAIAEPMSAGQTGGESPELAAARAARAAATAARAKADAAKAAAAKASAAAAKVKVAPAAVATKASAAAAAPVAPKAAAPAAAAKPAAKPANVQKPAAPTTVSAAAPANAAPATPAKVPAKVAPVVQPEPDMSAANAAATAAAVTAAAIVTEGETKLDPNVKAGSAGDTRAAKKVFGAAKSPAPLAARAIGGYAKGCLAGGRALAIDGPAWQAMRLSRNRNWGHPKLIALLERFAKEMQEKENWPGLLIGDIAQPRGGPMLTGHKSHQLGLDADIWFRPLPAKRMTVAERETAEPLLLAKDNGSEVIAENYNEGFMRLVKRAASYPEVERVFVHPAIKKAFCAGAGDDRAWLHKVRPIWLHNYHFHVRMGCPADSPTCVPQKAIEEGDGCGKDLDNWIKLVSTPPKVQPKPVEPKPAAKPEKPKPPLMLKDLPPECTEVATAPDAKPEPAKPPVPAPAVAATPAPPVQAMQR